MSLPKFLAPYLASYDLDKLDLEKNKEMIITEILNKGDGKALKWLANNYTKMDIKQTVATPMKGSWFRSVLKYWHKIFAIDPSPSQFNKAIIDFNA
ncbi:MAG TPA: hypothetical protein VI795_01945 [Patescibacteria group bacterium]|nr:hypothetical protein [Patescibacteria group bacterium]